MDFIFSDYGSSSSTNNTSSWPSGDSWNLFQPQPCQDRKPIERKSASYQDLVMGKCTLDDIMKEFRMNGMDSPYTPDEDMIWSNNADNLVGMGPAGAYLRQKSWPEPERTPAPRLPRPRSEWLPSTTAIEFNAQEFISSTPVEEVTAGPAKATTLTEEQLRVLNSLPNAVLFPLLKDIEHARGRDKPSRMLEPGIRGFRQMFKECRFCKNNGEREKFYTSHNLRDAVGRISCPVLRAFRCRRCGATGNNAHTDTYCPLATPDERMKSAAMMRSVRTASGRRRAAAHAAADCDTLGDNTLSYMSDNRVFTPYSQTSPLDPMWEALEKKLIPTLK